MEEKKLGLFSVIATGVGVIVATSCLLSLGQGAGTIGTPFIISMILACLLNCFAAFAMSELNALMPNLTGGLAQYTLACVGPFITILIMVGGYIFGNIIVASVECAMFGNTILEIFPNSPIPSVVYCVAILVVLIVVNLNGVDLFAKVQNVVAWGLIASLLVLGLVGAFGLGTGKIVDQPAVVAGDFNSIINMCGLAFFLFIASEFVIPISKDVKNAKRNVPLGMVLSLLIILIMQSILVIGFKNYTPWGELAESAAPHILYGTLLLGKAGQVWMAIVAILAVISTVNSNIAGLANIAAGMAKIGLLPEFFMKKNKKSVPYLSILIIGGIMVIINITGLSTTDQLSFMILSASVILMLAYVLVQIDVLILRKRLPKAPRSFKMPGGIVIPIIGMLGTLWMVWHIAEDNITRFRIYGLCLVMFIVLALYAVPWLKKKKRGLFKPIPVEKVMAMENDLYLQYHKKNK
jgi:amino acid transporter